MRRPFVVRVQNDDPAIARCIARALVPDLRERGARVLFEGQLEGEGASFGVHLVASARGLPGSTVSIGVVDDANEARWLAPLEVDDDPLAAAPAVIRFLETWGFVPAAAPPARGAPRAYAS